ncbi:thioesterase [Dactylosporangium roseum]|uniref:Thioesterase n=1 Tax=Dactylosporangium roseum TaxID=47989 RepID=A0ABY5Z1U4_9ACTN|nr:alpha/beta fold hydrolase [Dactylosporangium roseum]UWZ34713.1 thioesterase [Dactylosporangium roseum]
MTDWFLRGGHQAAPRVRLYCFHHAGGSAAEFAHWHRYLQDTVEVCAVQLPGRAARINEQPYTRMGPLVADLTAQLLTDLPVVFFGHSFGALVAFEVARALAAARRPEPRHLFLSARPAPGLTSYPETIHDLPEDDFFEVMQRRHGRLPAELREHPELRALVLPYFRADYEVLETYRLGRGEPLAVPATVLGGTDDGIPLSHLEAWRDHLSGSLRVRMFPGDHFFLRPWRTALIGLIREVTT